MTINLPEPPANKIRGHAIAIAEYMIENSTQIEGKVVWQGSVSAVFRELKITQGYHTPIMRLLKQVGILEQLQSGMRNVPSVYVVLKAPGTIPDDEWPSITSIVKSRPKRLTDPPPHAKLIEQQVRAVESRLPEGLHVGKALVELQNQLDELRGRITELENIVAPEN